MSSELAPIEVVHLRAASWDNENDVERYQAEGSLHRLASLLSHFVGTPRMRHYYCMIDVRRPVNIIGIGDNWWVATLAKEDMTFFGQFSQRPPNASFTQIVEPIWELPILLPNWATLSKARAIELALEATINVDSGLPFLVVPVE